MEPFVGQEERVEDVLWHPLFISVSNWPVVKFKNALTAVVLNYLISYITYYSHIIL